jgi:hypothetical protein
MHHRYPSYLLGVIVESHATTKAFKLRCFARPMGLKHLPRSVKLNVSEKDRPPAKSLADLG